MTRLRYNGLATGSAGSLASLSLGASLTNVATSVTFNAALTFGNGTAVPTIASPDYLPLEILDAAGHLSEIVYLTAYTAAGTTGTITRGVEGTTGVAHASGDKVAHGPTALDAGTGVRYWTRDASSASSGTVPVTDTLISGMSITIPTSAIARTAFVDFQAIYEGNHTNIFLIYLDGVAQTHGITANQAGSSNYYDACSSRIAIPLTSGGTRTIDIRWKAVDATDAVTFGERSLLVDVFDGSSSGIAI